MKYNDKITQRLIKKKSNIYFKLSLIIFILTISVLTFSMIFYTSYLNENNNNYIENDTVHLIQIDGKIEESYRDLKTTDYFDIKEEVSHIKNGAEVCVFTYLIGLYDVDNDDMIKVIGVNKPTEKIICGENLEDGQLYTKDIEKRNITLGLQVTNVSDDGNIFSDEVIKQKYKNNNIINQNSGFEYFWTSFEDLREVYVTENTLLDMLKLLGKIDQDTNDIYNEEINNYIVVEGMYVYVNDIYEVESLADHLETEGYTLNYTFAAFDNMGDSLKKNEILFFIMITTLLLAVSINLFLSIVNYINDQERDMGILKIFGFSNDRIKNIYARNIDKVFVKIFLINVLVTWIITFITVSEKIYIIGSGLTIIIFILLLIIRMGIVNAYLPKIVRKDLLHMLNRENS